MTRKEMYTRKTLDFLERKDLKYQALEPDNSVLSLYMSMRSCRLNTCRLLISLSDEALHSIAVCPINATPAVYDNVVEFITRANHGLKTGCFEFDYEDGEVRYRTHLHLTEGEPCDEDIEHYIIMPFIMMRRYGDGLVKNLMGFGNPEQDIAEIEG